MPLRLVPAVPGSLLSRLVWLAAPSVAEQVVLALAALLDVYIIGRLGATALAAVSVGGQALTFALVLYRAIGTGATAVVAREVGAQDWEEASRLTGQALVAAFLFGSLVSLGGFFLAGPIVRLFGAPADVAAAGTIWLRIITLSFAPTGLLLAGSAALRGAGNTRTPLWIMAVANLTKLGLASALMFGLWESPRLGLAGNSIGAVIGQLLGAVIALGWLARRDSRLRLDLADCRPDLARIRRIFRVGWPAGLEQFMFEVVFIFIIMILARIGATALAAYHVSFQIAFLALLPGWGISVAVTTLVGQELGRGSPEQARRSSLIGWLLGLALTAVTGFVLYTFATPIMRLFTREVEVVSAGAAALRVVAVIQPLVTTSFILSSALYGAGDTRSIMLIAAVSTCGFRLVVAYLASVVFHLGLPGVWLGIGGDYACRSILMWLRFRSGVWQKLVV